MKLRTAVLLLVLAGCASVFWRPDSVSDYSCSNTDVSFSVDYSWGPPRARLTIPHEDPIDLPELARVDGQEPDHYRFGDAAGNVRLTVTPRGVYLHRAGQRELFCHQVTIVVT